MLRPAEPFRVLFFIMAKDPAVLWYFNDWHGGTSGMSRHLKGCYMDLLYAQSNIGHLSIEEVKEILHIDFETCWPKLKKKFEIDSDGLFFNKRLLIEKEKRLNYTESRRKNRKKYSYEEHMTDHMENENVNENVNEFEELMKGIVLPFKSEKFLNSWNEWLAYRKQIGKKYKTKRGVKMQLDELSNYDEDTACMMIKQSMKNEWQGIFELKENINYAKNQQIKSNQQDFKPGGAGKL